MNIYIRQLILDDLYFGYLECLKPLTKKDMFITDQVEILKERYDAGIFTYVAIDLDRNSSTSIVGTASLVIVPRFVYYKDRYKAASIEDVSVLEEYQGRGVGQKLVGNLIEEAKMLRCYKVTLNCSEKNKEFYKKLGFSESETQMRMDL